MVRGVMQLRHVSGRTGFSGFFPPHRQKTTQAEACVAKL